SWDGESDSAHVFTVLSTPVYDAANKRSTGGGAPGGTAPGRGRPFTATVEGVKPGARDTARGRPHGPPAPPQAARRPGAGRSAESTVIAPYSTPASGSVSAEVRPRRYSRRVGRYATAEAAHASAPRTGGSRPTPATGRHNTSAGGATNITSRRSTVAARRSQE